MKKKKKEFNEEVRRPKQSKSLDDEKNCFCYFFQKCFFFLAIVVKNVQRTCSNDLNIYLYIYISYLNFWKNRK